MPLADSMLCNAQVGTLQAIRAAYLAEHVAAAGAPGVKVGETGGAAAAGRAGRVGTLAGG